VEKVHFAIEKLLEAPDGWRSVVRDMVHAWPDARPSELIFTLATAAADIEATFGPGSPARDDAAHAWRLAALLGTDLYAMEALGLPRGRAADLETYWAVDPYFRDL
jgi:hypothetical protein